MHPWTRIAAFGAVSLAITQAVNAQAITPELKQRTLERQAQEATFSQRSLDARRAELNRTMETAHQQVISIEARISSDLTRWWR